MNLPASRLFVVAVTLTFFVAAHSADRQPVVSVRVDFPEFDQQPSDEEFLLAAKRAFYSRNLEFVVIDSHTVRAVVEKFRGYALEIRRLDHAVEIRYVGDAAPEGRRIPEVERRLNNLKRDLVYELGAYLL